jgi:hypothetical protein
MSSREHRNRQLALDRCLQILEEAQMRGRQRVDGPLGVVLRLQLERAGVMVEHRLEGRRLDRVLDDVFAMQAHLLGQEPEERRQRTAS